MKYLGPILFLAAVLVIASAWLLVYPQLLDHYQSYPRTIYDIALHLGAECI